ncbi:MAG: hypothetical protein EX271_09030 [Acidimicrobiales bacterium]|nr:hypothetical protein [Hyphomonadaceae bacterium]RZV40964.1 MAG: hypothetical protein EX271_09030 [Acidimicrobiales bacterium]
MATIEIYFKDTQGLGDALTAHDNIDVSPPDEKLIGRGRAACIWIGVSVPIEEIKTVLAEALHIYPHLQYYKLSTDYYQAPRHAHHMIGIGGETDTATRLGLKSIAAADLLEALPQITSSEILFRIVRATYPGAYKVFDSEKEREFMNNQAALTVTESDKSDEQSAVIKARDALDQKAIAAGRRPKSPEAASETGYEKYRITWLKYLAGDTDSDNIHMDENHWPVQNLSSKTSALGHLEALVNFTTRTPEDGLADFTELNGTKFLQEFDERYDILCGKFKDGTYEDWLESQYLPNPTKLLDFVTLMWFGGEWVLADKYLKIARKELANFPDNFQYYKDKARVMQAFANGKTFRAPKPSEHYDKSQLKKASLLGLMAAIANKGDVNVALAQVDKDFKAANKSKKSPQANPDFGHDRLRIPWNFEKQAILMCAQGLKKAS